MKKLLLLLLLTIPAQATSWKLRVQNLLSDPVVWEEGTGGSRWSFPPGKTEVDQMHFTDPVTFSLANVPFASCDFNAETYAPDVIPVATITFGSHQEDGQTVYDYALSIEQERESTTWFYEGFTLAMTISGFFWMVRIINRTLRANPEAA